MTPFLLQVAQTYIANELENLTDYTFVFPNKRSGVFFSNYMLRELPSPIIMPQITTISDFISDHSSGVECSRMELIFILFDEYRKIILKKNPEAEAYEFDKFQFWADMLLNDFADVDKYLVDAKQLFKNVKDLKEINSDFLTDEQREAISYYMGEYKLPEKIDSFWKHIQHDDKNGQLTTKFVRLWDILNELYVAFRERLTQMGLCYSGMSYREVAEKYDFRDIEKLNSKRFIFVGFNVLSLSEIKIFEKLKSLGLADFYWDLNSPAYIYRDNRATRFVGKYVDKFKSRYEIEEGKIEEFPNINVIGIPSSMGQTKETSKIISSLKLENKISEINTAIVLPDEGLFIPLIHSLPQDIDSVNITMGYPMRHTSVAVLMGLIVSMQLRARKVHEEMQFFYEDVVSVLSHGILRAVSEETCKSIVKDINENRAYNISASYISKEYPIFTPVFTSVRDLNDAKEVVSYVKDLLLWIKSNLSKKSSADILFVDKYLSLLDVFAILINKYKVTMSESTVIHLMERMISSASVNFEGEPLKGLQIMGVLETRALDFENLIILSMNERIFPRKHYAKTFIPNELRRGYGMSTVSQQESMYAYYFYRMITRAKNVYIMYDSRAQGANCGEMSRFLYQLKYLYNRDKITFKAIKYPVKPTHKDGLKVEKTPEIIAILNSYKNPDSKKNLSASSLKDYIKCSMKFYLCKVEGYDYEEEDPEFMDDKMFGTVLHEVVENFYIGLRGDANEVCITKENLDEFKKLQGNIYKLITRSINKHYNKLGEDNDTSLQGDSKALGDIMLHFIISMFEKEKQFAPFYFIDAEYDKSKQWKINDKHTINFRMLVDRIDRVNDMLRFIDYKTGSDEVKVKPISKLFEISNTDNNGAIFQLLVYCFFYAYINNYKGDIQPYIYKLRTMSIENLPPIMVNGNVLNSYLDCADEFWQLFENMINEIFDESIPFIPTTNEKTCSYCSLIEICNKKKSEY